MVKLVKIAKNGKIVPHVKMAKNGKIETHSQKGLKMVKSMHTRKNGLKW